MESNCSQRCFDSKTFHNLSEFWLNSLFFRFMNLNIYMSIGNILSENFKLQIASPFLFLFDLYSCRNNPKYCYKYIRQYFNYWKNQLNVELVYVFYFFIMVIFFLSKNGKKKQIYKERSGDKHGSILISVNLK